MNNLGLILFSVFVGHLVGDYIFQNDWMALNKKKFDKQGWIASITHCIVYTNCICAFLSFSTYIDKNLYVMIFFSHFIFDKFEIVGLWMKFYGKQSWDTNLPLEKFKLSDGEFNIKNKIDWKSAMTTEQIVKTVFGSFVYIMTDMAFHFVTMYFIILYYFGG